MIFVNCELIINLIYPPLLRSLQMLVNQDLLKLLLEWRENKQPYFGLLAFLLPD